MTIAPSTRIATTHASVTGVGRQARAFSRMSFAALMALAALGSGCEEGGVGDPCIPEDEYRPEFPGYARDEVNVESRSFQCETRVCLVNNFQGRVSCPYGQDEGENLCNIPDGTAPVTVPVRAQLQERRPDDAVYCSCRCDGPQANAPYCDCPDGFSCRELISDIGLGNRQLAGSYCVRNGTEVTDSAAIPIAECDLSSMSCGDPNDFF